MPNDPPTLELPLPPNGDTGEGDEDMPVDPTIDKVLDQGFANQHDAAQAARERRRDAADNVAEQTRVLFLEEKFKVGVREAEASKRLDDNKLAQNILAQRSAKGQPQAT